MKSCLVLFSVHVLAVSLNRAIGLSPRCWPSPRVGVQGTFPQDLPGFLQPPSPFCCYPFAIPSSFPLPGCPISRFFLPGGPPIPSDPQDWVCPRGINPGVVGEPVWHRLESKNPALEQFVARINCSSWWQQSPKNRGQAASSVCRGDLVLGVGKPEKPTNPGMSPQCPCDKPAPWDASGRAEPSQHSPRRFFVKNHPNEVWEGGSDPPVLR